MQYPVFFMHHTQFGIFHIIQFLFKVILITYIGFLIFELIQYCFVHVFFIFLAQLRCPFSNTSICSQCSLEYFQFSASLLFIYSLIPLFLNIGRYWNIYWYSNIYSTRSLVLDYFGLHSKVIRVKDKSRRSIPH